MLFLVRIAQGLVHMGKGLLTFNPYHTDNQLVSGALQPCCCASTWWQTGIQDPASHCAHQFEKVACLWITGQAICFD